MLLPSWMAHWAPGALVALAAVLLYLALGRWYDRLPRRVLLVFGLALLLFYGEVLVGGRVLLPLDGLRGEPPFQGLPATDPHGNLLQGDLLYLVHPLGLEVRRAVGAGEWPLWTPRMGGGVPLLANPQAQAFQPLAAAGWVLPPEAAPGAVAALRTLLALVFSFLLLRRLGAGRGPALAGSLAFGLGGYLQLWLGWPLANTAALLPAALYAVVLADERGARRDRVLLAGSLACLLVAGHPETVGYGLALVLGLAGLRLRKRRVGKRWPFAGRFLAAAGLALLLAAPALLPFADALPGTLRWSRAGGGPEATEGVHPAARLVQAAAPNALGNSRFVHYWGLRNSNEDAAGFVGTAALLAALLALPGWLSGRRPLRHEGAALLVASGCAVLLALPGGLGSADGWLPEHGLSGRLALPLDLALAVLAAATLERLRRGGLPAWLPRVALPAAVALLALLHLWAVPAFAHPQIPETLEVLRTGWLHWHLRFLAAAGVLLFAAAATRWRGWVGPAVALLVGAELLLAHRPVNPPMPAELYYPEFPAVALLQEAHEATPPAAAGGSRVAAVGRVFLPNLGAVYGLSDVRVFDPMAPAAYLAALEPGIEWAGEIPLLPAVAVDRPVLDRLGLAWVMTAPGEPCPEGTEATYRGPDATVCRRPGALPLLRLEGAAPDRKAGSTRSLQGLRASAGGDRWSARLPEPAPHGAVLTTGLHAAPGWRLLADGRPVPVQDGPLLAAPLAPGTRRLDLLYRPASFLAGLLAAALGLALGAAWLGRAPVRAPPSARRAG